ncbi:MAG: hypothetical protein LQ342_001236 [Letrouitia transgressa]|nr:MAG: hypothetical protein LQ342_001236 [Letrouitia transgressa]
MNRAFNKARQLTQETHGDRRTRKEEGFQTAERGLPRLGSILSVPLADSVSSYLGSANPFAAKVDPKTECVWLLDNTAYRPIHPYPHSEQPWQALFIVAYFKKNTGKDISKVVADIADKIGLKKGSGDEREKGEKTIAERLQPFMDAVAPARKVDVKLPDGSTKTLGPGGRSAVSQHVVALRSSHDNGSTAQTSAIPPELTPHGLMTTHFAEPEGWMVISDIDDTIKRTLTPSPVGILRTTFLLPPAPIPSMPQLYSHLLSFLNPTWFYLSASPYNLHPFLRSFIRDNYPSGTILLREASWMDLGGFLASLTQGTEAYKRERMEMLRRMLPRRKVICIGDSTQSDPEAYGDICRKYPGWVKAVFIRKVTDVAEMNVTEKNVPERFEKAFKDVPKEMWRVFEDPNELYSAVDALYDR